MRNLLDQLGYKTDIKSTIWLKKHQLAHANYPLQYNTAVTNFHAFLKVHMHILKLVEKE